MAEKELTEYDMEDVEHVYSNKEKLFHDKNPIDHFEEENLRRLKEVQEDWENESQTEKERSMKIGRNDPCQCGSGIKYKKCCLG